MARARAMLWASLEIVMRFDRSWKCSAATFWGSHDRTPKTRVRDCRSMVQPPPNHSWQRSSKRIRHELDTGHVRRTQRVEDSIAFRLPGCTQRHVRCFFLTTRFVGPTLAVPQRRFRRPASLRVVSNRPRKMNDPRSVSPENVTVSGVGQVAHDSLNRSGTAVQFRARWRGWLTQSNRPRPFDIHRRTRGICSTGPRMIDSQDWPKSTHPNSGRARDVRRAGIRITVGFGESRQWRRYADCPTYRNPYSSDSQPGTLRQISFALPEYWIPFCSSPSQ